MRVFVIISLDFLLWAGVFLSGSQAAYCDMIYLPSTVINFNIAGVPTPTFTSQPASSIFANTEATYTTQSGKTNYTWTVPGVFNTDYSIVSGGIGTTSNSVTIKWMTSGSKIVTVNYTENGSQGIAPALATSTVELDTQAPVITCQASFIDEQCKYLSTYFTPPVYSDNCGVVKLTWAMTGATTASSILTGINTLSNYPLGEGITTITYTVYDAANNSTTCSFNVTVVNNGSKCASNDFALNKFFLADENGAAIIGNCTPGNPVNAYLYVLFTPNTNADRYSLKIQYDLAQNGIHKLEGNCFFDRVPILANVALKLEPIVWTCGEKIQINNFYFSWQTKVQTCDCTPSQCSSMPGPIDVELPLRNRFTYNTVCDPITMKMTFHGYVQDGKPPYTYSWNFGADAIPSTITVGPTITTENIQNVSYTTYGTKTVTLTVTDGNSTVLSESNFSVDVSQLPVITGVLNVCAGSTTLLTGTGTPATSNTWVSQSPDIATVNSSGVVSGISAGTSLITYTNIYGCSTTATVTVKPKPSVNNVNNQSYCNGSVAPVTTITSNVSGSTFSWSNSNTAIGLAANGTGNVPSFTATNSTTTTITSSITITPTSSLGCVGFPFIYTVTVYPTPTVNPITNQVYCLTSQANATTLTGSVSGSSFAWANNNTMIGLGASGTGSIPTFQTTNSTGSMITGTITVTPSANGCTGIPSGYTVSVNPLPVVSISSSNVCVGSAMTLSPSTGGTWLSNNTSVASVTSTGVVTGLSAGSVTFTFTDASTNCSNTTMPPVTVLPLPTLTATAECDIPQELGTYHITATISSGSLISSVGIVVAPSTGNIWVINGITKGTNAILTVTGSNTCTNTFNITAPNCDCPVIEPPLAGVDQDFCEGDPIPSISATVPSGLVAEWYNVPINGTWLAEGPTYTPTAEGIYYVEARDPSHCENVTRIPVKVTMHRRPSITTDQTTAALCYSSSDQKAYLDYTTVTETPTSYSISWNPSTPILEIENSTLPSSPFEITVPGGTHGTFTGTITVFNEAGCSNNSILTFTLTVYEEFKATVSGATSVCSGSNPGTLTVSAQGGAGTYTYQWYSGTGIITGETHPTFDPGNLTSPVSYYCVVSDASCGTINTSTLTISIYDLPVCSVTGPDSLCPGGISTYVVPSGMGTYAWDIPDNATIQGSSNGSIVSVKASSNNNIDFHLKLAVSNINGCTSNCEKQVAISDNADPTFIKPQDLSVCVESLKTAVYNPSTIDINPDRPDYYLFVDGDTMLDVTGLADNCCTQPSLIINWRIDFSGGIPSSVYGIGQPSGYDIQFPGNSGSSDLVHTITYWVTDCNGNVSDTQVTKITVKPRPEITKVN